ncbi:hypothetical protein [Halocatena marina]|uniref:hypothetical protein n=1 Tax=Halocatena marina TaxID=2934937 RepID=UPI00200E83E7|nr:hypothetical protein [Halocatena marina]
MYTLPQLWRGVRRGLSTPSYFARELNRLYNRQLFRYEYNIDGVDVMEEEWDNLIVLDACRYDLFADHHDLPGTLERRISRGSHTVEFLIGNFSGKDLLDTVYVTASPQLHRRRDRINTVFHDVINVWQREWDEEHGTVLPETMTKYGRRAAKRYPNKRLIIHYIQPHYPFIENPEIDVGRRLQMTNGGKDIWEQLLAGETTVSRNDIWQAYRNNFRRVLPSIHELLDLLVGASVVTSDHGNMIGERSSPLPIREWGHPSGTYTEELVMVPWQVIPSTERRNIRSEPPKNRQQMISSDPPERRRRSTEHIARDRLRDLGYYD